MNKILVLALLYHWSSSAFATGVWYLMPETYMDPVSAVKYSKIEFNSDEALVASNDDCSNITPGSYRVAMKSGGASSPPPTKKIACVIKGDSLLQYGIARVDISFSRLNIDPINWNLSDAAIKTIKSNNGFLIAVRPWFDDERDAAGEGFRQAVDFIEDSQIRTILPSCHSADVSVLGNTFAIACGVLSVMEQEVYSTYVLRKPDLKKIASIDWCRSPVLVSEFLLKCSKQTVSSDGKITLRSVFRKLPS